MLGGTSREEMVPAQASRAEDEKDQNLGQGAQRSMRSTAGLYAAPSHSRITRVEWCISRKKGVA